MIMLIKEILKVNSSFNFSFAVATDESSVVIQNDIIRDIMRQLFGKQAFCYENDYENETAEEVASAFGVLWHTFLSTEQDNFDNIYTALTKKYNPLENYDKTEHETNNTKHKDDVLRMQKGTTITTTYGQYEENTRVSTYEAGEKDERTITKGHRPNSSDIEGASGTNTDTTQYGDIDITKDNHISGNIGVTTSQQMLQSEIEIRQYNFVLEVVKKFVRLYCFTYWGDC